MPFDPASLPLDKAQMIEASAGTGKTYTITSLILRMLVEQERPIDSILAVTFTNAATAELKGRVYERIEEARQVVDAPATHETLQALKAQVDRVAQLCP